MADGTLRPIERVFKGDLVLATDPETGATVARRVTALIRGDGLKDLAVVWAGGQRLIATDEHPFYTVERGWVAAADLRRGEHLRDAEGKEMAVDAVLDLQRVTWVYNLTVEGLHTYYAGADPVLVHNARPGDCGKLTEAIIEPRGGVYTLRDEAGDVMRTGRSKNLRDRRSAHGRAPETRDYEFRVEHRTDDYATQRGLEDMLNTTYNAPLDKIRAIALDNKRRDEYLAAADEFLKGLP
jgi:hypothetical protein